ncbi:MAG: enoyl ACP reductase FabMG family protein [Bdellovibrionales bacterium]
MENFKALRSCPQNSKFKSGDLLVVFGEVFDQGYVNGMVQEAERIGMKVVYGTVGRRDENNELRVLTAEEIAQKGQSDLINIPLEAGFDLDKSSKGLSPCDQLKGLKRDEWNTVEIDWDQIKESQKAGLGRFLKNSRLFINEVLDKHVTAETNVHFAHTMAGGIPRAKILMPLLNRVFKGSGKRFLYSKEFWDSEIGKLCSMTFDEVTANTFETLITETENVRDKAKSVSYSAYGYHGCEPLLGDEYKWQTYAPYLQGWAKVKLENIAKKYWDKGLHTQVFNAPEILTASSSVFMGVEVCLYPLLRSLKFENDGKETSVHSVCAELLNDPKDIDTIDTYTQQYMNTDPAVTKVHWDTWPQHNEEPRMAQMKEASDYLISLHKDPKSLLTLPLSQVVFKTTGKAILCEASKPTEPVLWLGHDLVSKTHLESFEK